MAKKYFKILVPVLIFAIIAGIWIVKKSGEEVPVTSIPLVNMADADFSLRETEAIDFQALSAFGLPIIVDYGADACIPCRAMAPVLEKANTAFAGKAFVKFINVWDCPDAANNVPVQLIPTQIIIDADGNPFVPSEELSAKIQFDKITAQDTGEHIFTVHQGGLTEEQLWAIMKEMGVSE